MGYNKEKVVVPICAMKGGQDLQKYVDLLIPGPAKLTLLQGEGPIHLAGSHCVDFFGFKDGAGESEDEDDVATADEEDAKAEVAKEGGDERSSKDKKDTPTKEDSGSKKRKASTDPKSAEKK